MTSSLVAFVRESLCMRQNRLNKEDVEGGPDRRFCLFCTLECAANDKNIGTHLSATRPKCIKASALINVWRFIGVISGHYCHIIIGAALIVRSATVAK
jgi:hypothetical protein